MGILNLILEGVLHTKRGESEAARAGRRSAIKADAENPHAPGSKEFLEWMSARKDEQEKMLESQQW